MKYDIRGLVGNLLRKYGLDYHLTRITNTLHEDLCIFMKISHSVLLRKRIFWTQFVESIKTHIMFKNFFFRKSRSL